MKNKPDFANDFARSALRALVAVAAIVGYLALVLWLLALAFAGDASI